MDCANCEVITESPDEKEVTMSEIENIKQLFSTCSMMFLLASTN